MTPWRLSGGRMELSVLSIYQLLRKTSTKARSSPSGCWDLWTWPAGWPRSSLPSASNISLRKWPVPTELMWWRVDRSSFCTSLWRRVQARAGLNLQENRLLRFELIPAFLQIIQKTFSFLLKYWKHNFSMNLYAELLVGLSVGRSKFLKKEFKHPYSY